MGNKNNQKPTFGIKQLIETSKGRVKIQKGDAIITAIKEGEDCYIHTAGTDKDLLNTIFTVLHNDMRMAALIGRATKDYIETLKQNPAIWMELTHMVNSFDFAGAEGKEQGNG